MKFTILTLFPEFFPGPLSFSLLGKSYKKLWDLEIIAIRDFAKDVHKTVDDKPFGGGSGMIMRADVLGDAIDYAAGKTNYDRFIYPSPRGKVLSQALVKDYSTEQNILFLCGRYEGIDQRLIEYYNFEEVSIGDYIISGGELATSIIIDSILRHLPGVIKNQNVHEDESFHQVAGIEGILEYPQYTRPHTWKGTPVPEILASGNHQKINNYRLESAIEYTRKNRPDLLNKFLEKNS